MSLLTENDGDGDVGDGTWCVCVKTPHVKESLSSKLMVCPT